MMRAVIPCREQVQYNEIQFDCNEPIEWLGSGLDWSSGAALKTDKQRVSVDHPVLQLLFKVFPTTTAKVGRITARIAPPLPFWPGPTLVDVAAPCCGADFWPVRNDHGMGSGGV